MEGDGRRHEKMSGWKWGDEGDGGGRARYPDVFGGGGPVRDTMGLRTEDGGALALAPFPPLCIIHSKQEGREENKEKSGDY